MLTICTGWSPNGYREYGQRFAETFARYWPEDVRLIVYGEEPVPLPRGEFYALDKIPGCVDFLQRHYANKAARGLDIKPTWKESARAAGYNYKFDAWKFSRQGFIPWQVWNAHMPCDQGPQYLAWLDGDVFTHAPVPSGWLESLLPAGYDLAYLGRGVKHSEIGFQLYRLTDPWCQAARFLAEFRRMYSSDLVFGLDEWHSAFVWDSVRRAFPDLKARDLTPGGRGHVWHQSPLAQFTDHLKGNRKGHAQSPERRRR